MFLVCFVTYIVYFGWKLIHCSDVTGFITMVRGLQNRFVFNAHVLDIWLREHGLLPSCIYQICRRITLNGNIVIKVRQKKRNCLFAQTRKWKRGSVGQFYFFYLFFFIPKDTLRRKHDRISLLYICKHVSLLQKHTMWRLKSHWKHNKLFT